MVPKYPERRSLALLPTPLEELQRLTSHLGKPRLYVKRDDQTGLALGGNKSRKLEFLAADALAKGCDHLVTTGAGQSNHCRQTAAAAAALGLGCTLVLKGEAQSFHEGNLLLDRLLGADVVWTEGKPVDEVIEKTMTDLSASDRKPYLIPLGGSNALGAIGYVQAMGELMEQVASRKLVLDAIVFATSSGGTQAGLVLGAQVYGFEGLLEGISIEHPAGQLKKHVHALAGEAARFLNIDFNVSVADVTVNDDYLGDGYGIMGQLERDAILTLSRNEGLLLDPVYTARAMGGLLDLIQNGKFTAGQNVLFWHTGGTPALFAYGELIL